MKKNLAFIDLDNCLSACNLSEILIHLLMQENALSQDATKWQELFFQSIEIFEDIPNLEEIFKLICSLNTDIPLEKMQKASERVVQLSLHKLLRPEMLYILNAHKQKGDTVVLLSCSSEMIVIPLSKALGIEHAFGLIQKELKGKLSGELGGIYNGKKKLAQMHSISEKLQLSLDTAFFYTDSYDDRLPLQTVGHPIAAFPDKNLKLLAKEMKWTIIEDQAAAERCMAPKILIVTAASDAGHMEIAQEIERDLLTRLRDDHDKLLYDPVIISCEEWFLIAKMMVQTQQKISEFTPQLYQRLHDFYNQQHKEKKDILSHFWQPNLGHLFQIMQPQGIICVHPFGSYVAEYAKIKDLSLPILTYVTDWFGNCLHMWANPASDLIYCPSQRNADYLIEEAQASPEKLFVGNPIIPQALDKKFTTSKETIKKAFNLDPALKTLLFDTHGIEEYVAYLEQIAPSALPLQIIVLCQGNKAIEDKIRICNTNSLIKMIPVLNAKDIGLALAASDVVFARPSVLLTQEALAGKKALLFATDRGIMPPVKEVVAHCLKRNIAISIANAADWHGALSTVWDPSSKINAILQNVAQYEIQSGINQFGQIFQELLGKSKSLDPLT